MPISLHRAIVPGFIQVLDALDKLIDKAAAHCAETGADPETIVGAQLAPDMLDFSYQIHCCSHHSLIAIKSVADGNFSPPAKGHPRDFAGMQAALRQTRAELAALDPGDVDDLIENIVVFKIKEHHIGDFDGDTFLLTFSQPNFYFHATTAYDILRHFGLPIGKLDFLGSLQKRP